MLSLNGQTCRRLAAARRRNWRRGRTVEGYGRLLLVEVVVSYGAEAGRIGESPSPMSGRGAAYITLIAVPGELAGGVAAALVEPARATPSASAGGWGVTG